MSNEAKSFNYSVSGKIEPLQRARFSGGRFYDSQRNFKMIFSINLQKQHGLNELFSGPIEMDVTFVMPIAKCHKSRQLDMIDSFHFFKPDLDNQLKMLLDCCNQSLFSDDCIVSSIIARKVYGEFPRTDFTITPLIGKYVKT